MAIELIDLTKQKPGKITQAEIRTLLCDCNQLPIAHSKDVHQFPPMRCLLCGANAMLVSGDADIYKDIVGVGNRIKKCHFHYECQCGKTKVDFRVG